MGMHDVLNSAYPYKFGVLVCKLRAFVVEFTSYASILTIPAFTIERWVAICFPLKLRVCLSLDHVFKVIGIAWAIAFVAALPMAFTVKVNRIALPVADDSEQTWTRLVIKFFSPLYLYCFIDQTEFPKIFVDRTKDSLVFFSPAVRFRQK
ncbi:unnamed protein product [Toxocara canis]|uniref:G_PROTEIN_RECEP_F1_2 domain-containing protein n=1 Tax=Toxocara canis TaxID=6265 RepID=A0A183VBN3_TOXCA|nr:unnamed protein product [Toxocara canis]